MRSVKNDMVVYTKEFGKGIVKQWWMLPLAYGLGAGAVLLYDVIHNARNK